MQCIVSCTCKNDAIRRGNRQALLTELCTSHSCRQIAIQRTVFLAFNGTSIWLTKKSSLIKCSVDNIVTQPNAVKMQWKF